MPALVTPRFVPVSPARPNVVAARATPARASLGRRFLALLLAALAAPHA